MDNIKDCFFQIPLHPDDAPWFAFSVPTINREAPRKRYHWRVLPQEVKNRPVICQWYVASLMSPVRAVAEKAIIHHYMDDVLMCAPNDDVLTHALDLTINALIVAGFELQESKVQRMPPWQYLGLQISKWTIVPQKLAIKTKIKTLADVHHLCGVLNWVRPWLGLTTEDLTPLFELLKGGEELSSPRVLPLEAEKALEKVLNPPIIRHFGANQQLTMKERLPVMVKDPETGQTEGPHEVVTWGHGYTCMSTPTGLSEPCHHPNAPEEDMELEEGLDIEGQDYEGWPTQQEWFAESYPGSEHPPPPAQVSAF
ncbi:hypothetical protein DUI87_03162 [Hirundo rustica rustica]|uniref:ribonuclease H n=1 Tax=Hirundo rustica rustica TaxID=333673 RepID=A0A3M0L2U0_HIRRU|nr:hypothetical protein DUI87_03162 [Hirundo rustica rustica]